MAHVLHVLGGDTLALILAGNVTGHPVHELLDSAAVLHLIVPMQGRTRISMTVLDCAAGLEYRFVPEEPEMSEPE